MALFVVVVLNPAALHLFSNPLADSWLWSLPHL